MQYDVRSFLNRCKDSGVEIVTISETVDPVLELAAIVKTLEGVGNPIVVFESIKGSTLQVVCGLFGDRKRISLALDCEVADAHHRVEQALRAPIRPVAGTNRPDVVSHHGEDVDLYRLPVPVHSSLDAGRYITAAVGVVVDPSTEAVNLGIYRLLIANKDILRVNAAPGSDLGRLINTARERGHKMNIAFVIGGDPVLAITSQIRMDCRTDGYGVAGALRNGPLYLVDGATSGLPVPMNAEVVIEGVIEPVDPVGDGPFGEMHYYYGSGRNAVECKVTSISQKKDALFVDIHGTHREHIELALFPGAEYHALDFLRRVVPSVESVHFPTSSAHVECVVRVAANASPWDARRAILAMFAFDSKVKHMTVVDHDIDLCDRDHVAWAVATRFDARRDLIAVSRLPSRRGDVSAHDFFQPDRLFAPHRPEFPSATKLGIDATINGNKSFPVRADLMDEELSERAQTIVRHAQGGDGYVAN